MLIKNVFDKLDDAIAYAKVCGAVADRVYSVTDEDGYHVNVVINDFKLWEMPLQDRKKIVCGVGGIEEYKLMAKKRQVLEARNVKNT